MPRIVSMIASATEIVCALGFENDLVARSHECDYPPGVKRLPICTGPRFDVHGSSLDIDQRVKSLVEQSSSIYRVDATMLREAKPDIIVTQDHCAVCAVSERDVALALADWPGKTPEIVSLSPNNLAEVWDSIRKVADALDVRNRGDEVVGRLQSRMDRIRVTIENRTRPTVACLEWLEPLMAAGNWTPELVAAAGGIDLFGTAGAHSPWMNWDQLRERDPAVIIAMPCGFDLAKTRQEMGALCLHPSWQGLQAVKNGRVYIADGNQFFNRPGPRLVESTEILAEIIHPSAFQFGHAGTGWQLFD